MRLRLEEARSSMSAARSQGKVLESLMQLKTSGQLPGIHGRLVCIINMIIQLQFSECESLRYVVMKVLAQCEYSSKQVCC